MSDHKHDDHDHQHGSYYVPDYSWWPILAAIALFIFGLGSVEYFGVTANPRFLIIGVGMLLLICVGWLSTVVRESRRGLYDEQMHRTFRWGMVWFIFSDVMLLITILGVIWYYRIFNLPELGGDYPRMLTHFLLWPNFVSHWPVLANPDPSQFTGPQQALTINWQAIMTSLIMFGSGATLYLANRGLRNNHRALFMSGLIATSLLAVGFLLLTGDTIYLAVARFGITFSSGIYGSVVMFLFTIYLMHILVATLILFSIIGRGVLGHFSSQDDFSVRAFTWFWYCMIATWVAIFISIY
jgi:cytochrome c oxidase subunit 3